MIRRSGARLNLIKEWKNSTSGAQSMTRSQPTSSTQLFAGISKKSQQGWCISTKTDISHLVTHCLKSSARQHKYLTGSRKNASNARNAHQHALTQLFVHMFWTLSLNRQRNYQQTLRCSTTLARLRSSSPSQRILSSPSRSQRLIAGAVVFVHKHAPNKPLRWRTLRTK